MERVSRDHLLTRDRLRTFITRRGRKVGVHTASEQDGTWKFHLQDRPINVLVLIAQDEDRYLHDYILPPKIVQDSWKQFIRHGKNIEVTIRRAAEGMTLVLGNTEIPIQ